MKPVALIIRDGWGISPRGQAAAEAEGNAPLLAKLPFHEHLYKTYPQSRLSASGEDVGLPAGQMGKKLALLPVWQIGARHRSRQEQLGIFRRLVRHGEPCYALQTTLRPALTLRNAQ